MTALPASLLGPAIAHRALHDPELKRPENSRAAIRAAIAGGYGIEIDLQLSADGQAMVFHDYALERLTAAAGPLRQRTADELGSIPLKGGDEGIPTLPEVLELVAGRVPLLIELKDQDGALGPRVGTLERAAAQAIRDYDGDAAFMSFNPHSVAAMAELAPNRPRGLTTSAFDPSDWPVPESRLAELRAIPDATRVDASFVSHDHRDLHAPRIAELAADGLAILCWTIRSPAEEAAARQIADNVTFEAYIPRPPA